MEHNRPRGREKHVTGPGKTVEKRGEGLGAGPVGDAGGYKDRKQQGRGSGTRAGGGGGMKLIVLLLVALLGGGGGLTALLGGLNGGSVSSGWQSEPNTGKLNTSVAPGARDKYTKLLGNGRDTATIMVYMCGTDLESRSSMGT